MFSFSLFSHSMAEIFVMIEHTKQPNNPNSLKLAALNNLNHLSKCKC